MEKEKFDPVLYKKFASNEATKNLKTYLDELYSDVSFKEDVLKNLNDENTFMINKLFSKVGKAYTNFAMLPAGSPTVAHAMKAPAPPLS